MQDKEFNQELDPEFEAFAWQEMRKILDVEMPVKKKRRLFLWIWWLAGGLVMAVALTLLWQTNYNSSSKEPKTQNSTSAIVKSESAKSYEDKSMSSENETEITIEKASDSALISKPKALNQDVQTEKTSKATSSPRFPPLKDKTILSNKPSPDTKIELIAPKKESTIISSPSPVTDLNTTSKPMKESIDLNKIALLPFPEFQMDPIAFPKRPLEAIDLHLTNPRFQWGIQLGLKSNPDFNLDRYAIGVVTRWSWSSRWSLRGALLYNYKNKSFGRSNADSALLTSDTSVDSSATSTPGLDPNTANAQDTTSEQIKENLVSVLSTEGQYHIISLPIQAAYKIHPKWSLGMGLELSYIFASKGSDAFVNQGRNTQAEALDFSNSVFGAAVSDELVRRWDIMGQAGLNFHPNKQIDLGLQYQYLFSPNKSGTSKVSLLDHGLRLSMNYYFNR